MKEVIRNRWFRAGALLATAIILVWYVFLDESVSYNVNEKQVGTHTLNGIVIENPWGDTLHAEEFRLVVPENRNQAGSNRIEIAFQRLRTTSSRPLPPVVVLAGGPGSSGIRLGRTEYLYMFRELQKYSDVILLDQRGTGLSIPNLQCPNTLGLPTDITTDIEHTLLETVSMRVKECVDHFRDHGVDVEAYNSVENANDIDDMRGALGYDKLTLYGYSFGSELAMVYMRQYPERVHGAIMAGPVAPDLALKLPSDVHAQFMQIDSLARLDKRLSRHMPDFLATMRLVHEGLQEQPRDVSVPLMDAVSDDDGLIPTTIFKIISFFRPSWEMMMGDFHLQMMVQNFIGDDAWFGRLPAFYHRMQQGDYRQVGNRLRNFRRQQLPNALFFTTNCATGYTAGRESLAIGEARGTILSHVGISFGRQPEVCEPCGLTRLGGQFLEPITSPHPVLFIVGTLDGRTPMRNLPELQRRFPNHQAIVVENGGHNQLLDNDIRDGILAFLRGETIPISRIVRRIEFDAPVAYQMSLADTLHAELTASGSASAIQLYHDLKRHYGDSVDYILDFGEASLNNLGYRLIAEGRYDDALAMLQLNAIMFPDAFNVYDSLGEAYKLKADRDRALLNYVKSIELNFLNGNAYGMLRELERPTVN